MRIRLCYPSAARPAARHANKSSRDAISFHAVDRRDFLSTTLAAPLMTTLSSPLPGEAAQGSQAPTTPTAAPGLFVWQHFTLRTGQPRRLADYFAKARIPALGRAGAGPVGLFEPIAGPPQPSLFALTPFKTADQYLALEETLGKDADYQAAATAYTDATAADPAYVRQETWLLKAFPTFPSIELPAQTAAKAPRIFELRIYESASEKAHLKKVEMFEKLGEIAIFKRTGLTPVFFARMVAGPKMPCLAYLLVHDSLAARDKNWQTFITDPEWRKVARTPGFGDAEIVSNITTWLLRPSAASQI
jgi:hypothetical protein